MVRLGSPSSATRSAAEQDVQFSDLRGSELDGQCAEILGEVVLPLGARNRHHIKPLGQDPGQRGELRADLDVDVAIDVLYGAIYYRLLVSHQPLSAEYARAVVDEVFIGLQAPGDCET